MIFFLMNLIQNSVFSIWKFQINIPRIINMLSSNILQAFIDF